MRSENYIMIGSRSSAFINSLFVLSFLLIVVFPNSFRFFKLPVLLLLFLLSLNSSKYLKHEVVSTYLLGITTTVVYILLGFPNAKFPETSTQQVTIVYISSPLLWLVISNHVFINYAIEKIIQFLTVSVLIGSFTVLLGIWLFDNDYLNVLSYVIENPNKTVTETGEVAIRFHVYGSMIFLFPAFIQLFSVYRNKLIYSFFLILFICIAFISGRSALLLSLGIGFLFLFITTGAKNKLIIFIGSLLVGYLIFLILDAFGINVINTVTDLVSKIKSGGEEARSEQFFSLISGFNENILGAGHGVGVKYVRSEEFPWRYEILPLATLYRVGLIGTVVYSLPFIYSLTIFAFLKRKNKVNTFDRFMIVGLVSLCIATFTNPYLESFEFQIFYFFPFQYFILRKYSEF